MTKALRSCAAAVSLFAQALPHLMMEFAFAAGLAMICHGAFLVHHVAGWIVTGIVTCVSAFMLKHFSGREGA